MRINNVALNIVPSTASKAYELFESSPSLGSWVRIPSPAPLLYLMLTAAYIVGSLAAFWMFERVYSFWY